MPSPEGFSFSNGEAENTGETSREVKEARGEKTLEELKAEKQAALEENQRFAEDYFKLTGMKLSSRFVIETPDESVEQGPISDEKLDEIMAEAKSKENTAANDTGTQRTEVDPVQAEKKNQAKQNQKTNKALKAAILGGLAAGVLAVAITTGHVFIDGWGQNKNQKTPGPRTQIEVQVDDQNEVVDTHEEEKDWRELTGVDEIDKTIDGSFTQNQDVGMWDTDGKYSKNSVANPGAITREYFDTEWDDATLDQKAIALQTVMYKTAPTAAYVLHKADNDFSKTQYIRLVEDITNASEEDKLAMQDKLYEIMQKAEWDETTVGAVREALRLNDEDAKFADEHYYINRLTGAAEQLNQATGDDEKVLTLTYENEAGVETTLYFLERCFNGFAIHKITDKTTNKTKIVIEIYERDEIEKKDKDNLERIDQKINDDIGEDINSDEVDPGHTDDVTQVEEQTDQPAPEEYTGTNGEDQIVEREPEISPETGEPEAPATEVQPTAPENDYSQDLGGANAENAEENPVLPDVEGQKKADENAIPVEQAPEQGSPEFDQTLRDLGIN